MRRLTRTMPSGGAAVTNSLYYGDTDQAPATGCTGQLLVAGQYGGLKKITGPGPASVSNEFVYDQFGRTVASRTLSDPWSCVTYDLRGRVTQSTVGGDRTVTNTYGFDGAMFVTTVTDPNGTITTKTDLLGRVLFSEDVWGTQTEVTYEPKTGRVATSKATPPKVGQAPQAPILQEFGYDLDGKVLTVKINGALVADPEYAANQLLSSVAYSNGTSLAGVTRNAGTGATDAIQWAFPGGGGSSVTDQVVRSQSGRIIANTLTDTLSPAAESSTFRFDAAGRLVRAVVSQGLSLQHELAYGFEDQCGVAGAGRNGNRTLFSDTFQGSTSSVKYCYDTADRLTGTTVTGAATGASNVVGENLTMTDANGRLWYDPRGNTTRLGDQALAYDITNRHIRTTLDDGTIIE